MSALPLIEAVKRGDLTAAEQMINAGEPLDQQDNHGWTALNWAAGRGDAAAINLLLNHGADALKMGRDQRTPYMIALAAGHLAAARLLRPSADALPGVHSSTSHRSYCKTYLLKDLRQFPGWHEHTNTWKEQPSTLGHPTLTDESVVFLHENLCVTLSMWSDEYIIFDQVTPEWKVFCTEVLGFTVPDDFDLIPTNE